MTPGVAMVAVLMLAWAAGEGPAAFQVTSEPANDFGFRIEIRDCHLETFETFTGVLTRSLGGEPDRQSATVRLSLATVRLSLSDDQLHEIFRKVVQIGFFDYPTAFSGHPGTPNVIVSGITSGVTTYILEVQNGGVRHRVEWKDRYRPSNEAAQELRALLSMITGFVHEHPTFKGLPPRTTGCL